MSIQLEQKTYTPEDYLDFETASAERHDYINGEIIPITGGTPDHNELSISLAAIVDSRCESLYLSRCHGCGKAIATANRTHGYYR
jgi:Uma2 family endonuclease